MAKRHQSNRRRSYGRRQHELRERVYRHPAGLDMSDQARDLESESTAWIEVDANPRLSFAVGD